MRPGDAVPELVRTVTLPAMVAYAGATWDWHRLHYDPAYLAGRGLDRPVVDGQLFGALLAEQLQDWLGPSCFVTRLWFRFAGLVFAGETVRCEATVTAVDGDLVTVDARGVVPAAGDRPERVAVPGAGAEVRVAAR